MKRFAFLAGLPRSGSTLLNTLLSQHPEIHTTPTSCILGIIHNSLHHFLGETPYFDLKDPRSPAWEVAKGILYGAYKHTDKSLVVEKDRGWPSEVTTLRRILGDDPLIVSSVRSIPEILSSFILLSQKAAGTSKIQDEVISANRKLNSWSLSRIIWERYVYFNWRALKTGYETNPDCFLLVEYDDLVSDSNRTMGTIYDYLKVPYQEPTRQGLRNPNPENDAIYGIQGLHDIRPQLKKTSPPAEEVLGKDCYEFWANKKLEFWRGNSG
jgi:sulfotransferase